MTQPAGPRVAKGVRPLTAWRARNWTGKNTERDLCPRYGALFALILRSDRPFVLSNPPRFLLHKYFPHFRSWA